MHSPFDGPGTKLCSRLVDMFGNLGVVGMDMASNKPIAIFTEVQGLNHKIKKVNSIQRFGPVTASDLINLSGITRKGNL